MAVRAGYSCPKGYKQTEVGIIPEDWDVAPLNFLVDPLRSIRYGIVQPGKFDPNGRYMIRGQDYSTGWVDEVEFFRVSAPVEERYANARVKAGDLLITIVGASTGRIAMVPNWLSGANLTQTTARIAIDKTKANNKYCEFILASKFGYEQVKNYIKGGAQPGLNCGDVEKFFVPLPPTLAEQKAIAAALSDADALIAALEGLIAKKRQIKQGAMQELFSVKSRKWKVKKLGELSEMGSGGTPTTSNPAYYDGDIPWVSITDMTAGGKFLSTTERNLTAAGLQNSSAQMFPAGTVLYAMYASLGECSIAEIPLCTSQAILGIRVKKSLDNEFLYYYLDFLKPQVKTMGQQGTQSNLNKGMVQDFELNLPPLPEQTAIAEILSDMDAEIEMLAAKLSKARQVKVGMMQELLTGRVRLI